MGIFDKFKSTKQAPSVESEKGPAEVKPEQADKPEKTLPERRKGGSSRAHEILIKPILSEKGTHLAASGKYVFAVHPKANKAEVRKSIQMVYDVHVKDVKIAKVPGKFRRYGRTSGRTSEWKKAIVTLIPGEKIPGIIEAVG